MADWHNTDDRWHCYERYNKGGVTHIISELFHKPRKCNVKYDPYMQGLTDPRLIPEADVWQFAHLAA